MISSKDHARYQELVNMIRVADGLAPLPSVVPVDDPRPLNRHMEEELKERGLLR